MTIISHNDGGRPLSFTLSVGIHAALVVALASITFPGVMTKHRPRYGALFVVPPPAPASVPKPPLRPLPPPRRLVRLLAAPSAPAPRLVRPLPAPQPPVIAAASLPALRVPPPAVRTAAPAVPPPPIPARLTLFASVPAVPAPTAAPHLVVTGSFSAAETVRTAATAETIAATGQFEPGAPRGTQTGSTRMVASAGFGDAAAAQSGNGRGRPGGTGPAAGFDFDRPASLKPQPVVKTAASGGFDPAAFAPRSAPVKTPAAGPPTSPVQILSKIRPDYTEEARRLKIEGEVALEAVFTASGTVRVLRVLHGLGHGLDEQALQAASQIRYKPAERDGQPVDFAGTIRVRFQLAY